MASDILFQVNEQLVWATLFAQVEPEAGGLPIVPLISRVLHILGALILGGGIFFLRSVLAPTGDEQWLTDRRGTWARWVGIATFVLIATGFYNFLIINGEAKIEGGKLPSTYHVLFGIKFLLGLVVMFLAAILAGKTPLAAKFRGKSQLWLNVAWFGVMAIIVVAGILRTMH